MTRCVVVVDETLAPGLAANAAAVMAVTLGSRVPDLVGEDFTDGAGEPHAGLITTGLPVLRAPAAELRALRARALQAEVGVIGMPAFGHQTNDYEEFRALVAETDTPDYLGLALYGPHKTVRRLTGSLGLLR
jgi:hypothetical protein